MSKEEQKKQTNEKQTNEKNGETQDAILEIQRIYIKDVSFEAPNLPYTFQEEWKPTLKVDLNAETVTLEGNLYEVSLNILVETRLEDNDAVAFICEVKQAGVFLISGLEQLQLAHYLTSQCPSILFPYARELVSSLVNRGTFPALNLGPVNFDELFTNYLQKQEQEQQAEIGSTDVQH